MKQHCFLFLLSAGFSFITIVGCNSDLRTTSLEGLVTYVEDVENDVSKTVVRNDVAFHLWYEPLDVLVQKQLRTQLNSTKEYESLKNEYPQLEYYILEITSNTKNTRTHLTELFNDGTIDFQYYSDFGLQSNIFIVQNTDTISCSYLHREVSESITNSFKYLLGFENAAIEASDRLIIFNTKFDGIQQVEFLITNNSIASIPQLKSE